MKNVFDQFDQAPPATATDTRSQAQPSAQQTQPANPFDQFDPAPPAVKAPPPDNLGQEYAKGLVTGIPHGIESVLDSLPGIGGGLQAGIRVAKQLTGAKPDELVAPTVSGEIEKGLSTAHINPSDYFPEPKTLPGRVARMAGEGTVGMVAGPLGEEQGLARLSRFAKDLFSGAVGGAGSQVAQEAVPEPYKPVASILGGLAGGIGGATVAELPGMAARGAKSAINTADLITQRQPAVEREASRRLGNIVTDRDQTLANLDAHGQPTVPGSAPTSVQAAQDRGLGSYERQIARSDEGYKNSLLDRLDTQSRARMSALDNMQDDGHPAAVADYFRTRMRDLETRADDVYSRAEQNAQQAHDALGDPNANDVGANTRTAISGRFKELNNEASHLWQSIDPEHKLVVSTQPIVREAAKIYGAMSPEEKLSLSPSERAIAGIIGTYDPTLPFQRFSQLRSEISRAMREARAPLPQARWTLTRHWPRISRGRLRSGMQHVKPRPGLAVVPAMEYLKPEDRLPFLAILEQRARLNADLPAMRALKDYRKMLEQAPSKET